MITCYSLSIAGEANNKECLEYEPNVVSLTGVLLEQVFPGRPEHSNINEGDEQLTHWILHLKEPICVNGKDKDLINEGAHDIRAILLVASYIEGMHERHKNLLSKKVTVTGELYHSITAWHKTRVLIQVKNIKPATNK